MLRAMKLFSSPQIVSVRVFKRSSFHTSPRRDVGFLVGPIVRGLVALSARWARRRWLKMTPEKQQAIKESLYHRRHYFYGSGVALSAFGGLYYWSHLQPTPITGRQRFVMFSQADLVELIEQEKEEILKELVRDAQVLPSTHPQTQAVVSIVKQILTSNWSKEFEGLNWNVTVLDTPDVVNAVCLPNGQIFVFTGLLKACHNQDELAFILGHEIAHAILGHGAEGLSHKGLVEFLTLFLVAAVWSVIPSDLVAYFMHSFSRNTAHVLLDFPYSRKLETEADSIGLMLAANACFNPTKGVDVWRHLPSEELVEYLSTHPSHESRLENLSELLPSAHKVWEDNKCAHTKEELTQFHSIVGRTLKKIFSW